MHEQQDFDEISSWTYVEKVLVEHIPIAFILDTYSHKINKIKYKMFNHIN